MGTRLNPSTTLSRSSVSSHIPILFTILLLITLLTTIITAQSTCTDSRYCTTVSLLSTTSLRGIIFPVVSKDNPFPDPTDSTQNCISAPFDSKYCIGGCPRRAALAQHMRKVDPDVLVCDSGGGFFFGDDVIFTMYGTLPYQKCLVETGYDVLSLSGADLYVGLSYSLDFYTRMGKLNSNLQHYNILTSTLTWENQMQTLSFLHNNAQSPNVGNDNKKSKQLHDLTIMDKDSPPSLHKYAQQQLHFSTVSDYDLEQLQKHDAELIKKEENQLRNSQNSQNSSQFTFTPSKQSNNDDLDVNSIRNNGYTHVNNQFEELQTTDARKPYILSTNLAANNDKWSQFLVKSALVPIQSSTKGDLVAFLSILPDAFLNSVTNRPIWFDISPNYSALNHVRSQISYLRRSAQRSQIKAIVLLIQEDLESVSSGTIDTFRQLEHVNAVIAPRFGKSDSFEVVTNIYGNKMLLVSAAGGTQSMPYVKFTVDSRTNNVEIVTSRSYLLDSDLIEELSLQEPPLQRALTSFNIADEVVSKSNISTLLTPIYGQQFITSQDYYGYTPETWGCRTATCPMGLLTSKAMLNVCSEHRLREGGKLSNCTIAFINAGAIRGSLNYSPENPQITLSDLLRVYPFHNKLVSFDISGADMLRFLAHSISAGRSPRFLQSNLRWAHFPYNHTQSEVSVDDALSRVMDVSLPGNNGQNEPIKSDKLYRVLTVSYILDGNDGFKRVVDKAKIYNIIYHSDTLLTGVMTHLRRSVFTWEISREDMTTCLFNTTSSDVNPVTFNKLMPENCLHMYTSVTTSQYKTCPTDLDWCTWQQTFQREYFGDEFQIQTQGELFDDNFDKENFNNLDNLDINFDENNIKKRKKNRNANQYGSYHDYYLESLLEEYDQGQNQSNNIPNLSGLYGVIKPVDDENPHSFYSMIPTSDLTSLRLTEPNSLPERNPAQKRFYTTPSTSWASEYIKMGEIVFNQEVDITNDPQAYQLYTQLYQSQSNDLPDQNQFSIQSSSNSRNNITLVDDIHYDPELPRMSGDCSVCSGYGVCLASEDRDCECTMTYQHNSGLIPILIEGKPSRGLYRNIAMITGRSCSQVLQRYVQSTAALVSIYVLSFLTLAISLLSLLFVILWRKNPIIKTSGPDMMTVMCVGSILVAFGLFLQIYSPFTDGQKQFLRDLLDNNLISASSTLKFRLIFSSITICNLQFWLTLIGFVIMFGAILAKSYRIHRIFNAKTLHEIKQFSNRRTKVLLFLVILMQILLLMFTRIFSPMSAQASSIKDSSGSQNAMFWVECSIDLNLGDSSSFYEGIKPPQPEPSPFEVTANNIQAGSSSNDDSYVISRFDARIWVYGILALYNVLLLCCGIYLSIATRNVDKRFNESNILAIAIYNVVFCAIIYFLAFSMKSQSSKLICVGVLSYAIISTLLIMLGGKAKEIFFPKKQEEEDLGMSSSNSTSFVSSPSSRVITFDPITLRKQALEREDNYTTTITTQQEQIATLIQHILSSDTDNATASTSRESVLQGFEDSHHRHATTVEGIQAENEAKKNNKNNNNNNNDPNSTKPRQRFKPDVQSIIDQYCGLELTDVGSTTQSGYHFSSSAHSSILTNKLKMETAEAVPSHGPYIADNSNSSGNNMDSSTASMANSVDDEIEARRSRLKSTFQNTHLRKTTRTSTAYSSVPSRNTTTTSLTTPINTTTTTTTTTTNNNNNFNTLPACVTNTTTSGDVGDGYVLHQDDDEVKSNKKKDDTKLDGATLDDL